MYYKTQTILFQTIFDIELIKTYPRKAFYPPHISKSASKNVRFKEVSRKNNIHHLKTNKKLLLYTYFHFVFIFS